MSGLQITNPGNELVVSSDARLLHYIAKCSLIRVVQMNVGTPNQDPSQQYPPGMQGGYSEYNLYVPPGMPFLLGIDLPLGTQYGLRAVGLKDIQDLGGGNWKVVAYNGDTYNGWNFDTNQYALDIWAFGYTPVASTNYGLVLGAPDGTLAADFMRPHPFFPKWVGDFQYNKVQTIPPMGRPIAVGVPSYYDANTHTQDQGELYTYIKEMGFWNRSDATTLKQVARRLQQFGTNDDAPTNDLGNVGGPSMVILMDGINLP